VSNNEEITDIKGHWAEDVIRKWVSQGLAEGYGDGRFGPNDNITRAEFVTLLNRIFGYREMSEKSFPDVKPGAWYAAEIAKAYRAGIITGDNRGNMNPEAVITRQEAAVILTRAFALEGDHLESVLKYSDATQIADWALNPVGIMTYRGYVSGRPGGLFAPKANLSRSEAIKMMDNVMGELINSGGTYTKVVPGNLVISSRGVTLRNSYIAGDLYLTADIGDDTIKLDKVTVKGKTIITGDINNILMTDTILEQDVVVLKEDGKVLLKPDRLSELGVVTTPAPTATPKPTPKATPAPEEKPEPAPQTGQPEEKPTPTPKATITPKATPVPTPETPVTPTDTPAPTGTVKPTSAPTPEPTKTVKPTATPTPRPTVTVAPTTAPTPEPTATVTPAPQITVTPTPKPTAVPDGNTPGKHVEADIYVSPSGGSNAKGTYDDPFDLQTVLNSNSPAKPGDLVILKEGIYSGTFVSNVSGKKDAPIIFAAEPGKRVTIKGKYTEGGDSIALFINKSSCVEFRNLEITSGGNNRSAFTSGLEIHGPNTKVINCIIHDTAQGIFSSSSAVNSEIYGNIIYNNGFYSESYGRGRGHGIYVQNKDGTKRIANNILFFGYGFEIHAYTESGSIEGLDFERNVWFRAGASIEGSSMEGTSDGMLIGGMTPVDRTRVIENYSWSPDVGSRNVRLGWGSTVMNEFIEIKNNYFVGAIYVQGLWNGGDVQNNQFYGNPVYIEEKDFPNNAFSRRLPSENKVVLHENEYDPDRIDLIIYNWEQLDSVSVSPGSLIDAGRRYEIYSVFDLWGEPVASGVYSGGTIKVPMGTVIPVQPAGHNNAITGADDPGKKFGVFIIRLK